MKNITPALLATGLVLYALLALLSNDRFRDNARSSAINTEQTISEVGLLFGWHR
jgi:hypothetical protein